MIIGIEIRFLQSGMIDYVYTSSLLITFGSFCQKIHWIIPVIYFTSRVFLRGCSTCHEESPTVMSISMEYELPESQDESEKE